LPLATPVLNDIQGLRELEEQTFHLVYSVSIPVYQYKVGTIEAPATPEELDAMEQIVESLPSSGAIVTPERHDVTAIGADRKALDVNPYLKYFKSRVYAGLGQSSVGMGESDTANKATALVVSNETRQLAEYFQSILAEIINEHLIKEIMLEGGFKYSSQDDSRKVTISFPSIDKNEKRATENHVSQLFTTSCITETEMRAELGREPISKDQRKELHANLYPDVPSDGAQASIKSKSQPSNQHGKLASKPTVTKRN